MPKVDFRLRFDAYVFGLKILVRITDIYKKKSDHEGDGMKVYSFTIAVFISIFFTLPTTAIGRNSNNSGVNEGVIFSPEKSGEVRGVSSSDGCGFSSKGSHWTSSIEGEGKIVLAHSSCCKTCRNSQACGDSCISWSKTCHKSSGCACQG